MNRLLSLAAIGFTLTAAAVPQKLVQITIADRNTLIAQANNLGDITGFPMIGMGAVGLLSANPLVEAFGAMRDGEASTVIVCGDLDKLTDPKTGFDAFGKTCHFAALYPSSKKGDGAAIDPKLTFLQSEDGKWVAISDDAACAKKALAAAGKAKLAHGEALRVQVPPVVWQTAGKVLSDKAFLSLMGAASAADQASVMQLAEWFKQIKDGSFALRVSEKGVDSILSVTGLPGTTLAKIGEKKLTSTDPLAFADKNALLAGANAADCGNQAQQEKQMKALADLLMKHGVKFDFLSVTKQGTKTKVVLDPDALVAYLKGEGKATIERLLFDEKFQKEVKTWYDAEQAKPIVCEGPESAFSFAVKGIEFASSPSARFAKAFPEMKGRPLVGVGVVSLYGTLKKAAELMVTKVPDLQPQAGMVRDLLKTLPPDGDACCASATWKKGDRLSIICRITPEEVKGLTSFGMMAASQIALLFEKSACFDCDDDDDDDDDDDED